MRSLRGSGDMQRRIRASCEERPDALNDDFGFVERDWPRVESNDALLDQVETREDGWITRLKEANQGACRGGVGGENRSLDFTSCFVGPAPSNDPWDECEAGKQSLHDGSPSIPLRGCIPPHVCL